MTPKAEKYQFEVYGRSCVGHINFFKLSFIANRLVGFFFPTSLSSLAFL